MPVTPSAAALARALLVESLPRRFDHVAGVAARVQRICADLGLENDSVVSAAWLHDVGYAPLAVGTGFHALDGARFARCEGFTEEVCALVAHHSCAFIEADLRGLRDLLYAEFPEPDARLVKILTAADMSVGPQGLPMTIDARLADIRVRYARDHVVIQFVNAAEAPLRRAHAEVSGWVGQSQ